MSLAGLRGAVPIVLATIPMSEHVHGATRLFDLVFVVVVVFTTTLRDGDSLLVVADPKARPQTEQRLRAVGRAGKLAGWLGERGI